MDKYERWTRGMLIHEADKLAQRVEELEEAYSVLLSNSVEKIDKLAEQNEKLFNALRDIVRTYDAGHYLEELADKGEMDTARDLITEIKEGNHERD